MGDGIKESIEETKKAFNGQGEQMRGVFSKLDKLDKLDVVLANLVQQSPSSDATGGPIAEADPP